MRVCVVAHPARQDMADALATKVRADAVFVDCEGLGALGNHRRALEWAAQQSCQVAILEDDALPVPGFREKVQAWHSRFPDHLVSLYLGTGRPREWMWRADAATLQAERDGRDWIELPHLIHGVGYTLAPATALRIVAQLRGNISDYAIGFAYRQSTGLPVVYPLRSLVDHADTEPVERHHDGQPRTEPRRARALDLG